MNASSRHWRQKGPLGLIRRSIMNTSVNCGSLWGTVLHGLMQAIAFTERSAVVSSTHQHLQQCPVCGSLGVTSQLFLEGESFRLEPKVWGRSLHQVDLRNCCVVFSSSPDKEFLWQLCGKLIHQKSCIFRCLLLHIVNTKCLCLQQNFL